MSNFGYVQKVTNYNKFRKNACTAKAYLRFTAEETWLKIPFTTRFHST